jgi:hypothetical protein
MQAVPRVINGSEERRALPEGLWQMGGELANAELQKQGMVFLEEGS